jgi:hypothetical protein
MAEIARSIQQAGPADVRGMTDYGIATLRLAIVTPIDEKRAVLGRSLEILDRVVAKNPKDKLASMHKAWAQVELGDLQLAGGDPAGAARSYRLAIATCESTQAGDPADGPTQRWLVTAARKLSEQQARSGDRAGAVASIGTALGLAQRVDAAAPRDSVTLRSAVARAWDGAGTVYATLARQESGEARRQDLQTAREWYAKSMAEWHRLEPLRGFTAVRRKEMESAAAAQTALETAASKP